MGRPEGGISLGTVHHVRNELETVYREYKRGDITTENAKARCMILRLLADMGQDVDMDKRMKAIEKLLELKEAA